MPLEQELPNLLITGFIFIILLFAISTIALWVRRKGKSIPYILILMHLILLSTAFYFFMNAITLELDYNHPMASEENSLHISIASGFWALSMLSLFVAIFKFTNTTMKSR